ncbi:MAG: hypothetical protein KBG15_02475 [Kofleriaceae bacterium]|nr:hypothetical protein [Kofleriaceae bacterium]
MGQRSAPSGSGGREVELERKRCGWPRGHGVEANGANGWDFFDHRNRVIDAHPARTTPNNVSAPGGLAALHDAHAALAITANTNASKWTGEPIDYARCIDYLV